MTTMARPLTDIEQVGSEGKSNRQSTGTDAAKLWSTPIWNTQAPTRGEQEKKEEKEEREEVKLKEKHMQDVKQCNHV